jgi:hypothetical protein
MDIPFTSEILAMNDSSRQGQRLTDEQVRQVLLSKGTTPSLRDTKKKRQTLWSGGLFVGPVAMLITLLTWLWSETTVWIPVSALLLNLGWSLTYEIGHRPISKEDYESLPSPEQERRLTYESFWANLYGGGLQLFVAGSLLWGSLRIALHYYYYQLTGVLLTVALGSLLLVVARRDWIMRIYAEGAQVHPWIKRLPIILVAILAGILVLLRIIRATAILRGQDGASDSMVPIVVVAFVLVAVAAGLLGIVSLCVANIQYQDWRDSSRKPAD